jgi:ESS family glutamate:Na+ symporter
MDCDVVGLAGPIVAILGVQFILAFCFALFFVFRLMGRGYEAAVICSGFGEIYFGSTPTPTPTPRWRIWRFSKRYCAAHKAFMIVPRECGFFVDLANAVIIRSFLNWFASV